MGEKAEGSANPYKVFIIAFVLYRFTHFSYYFHYDYTLTWFTLLWFGLSLALLFRPSSLPLLALSSLVYLFDTWVSLPKNSNHMMIDIFLNLVILSSIFSLKIGRLRERIDLAQLYKTFAPGGRWLLLIMYFFGIFHKINTDFLDPEFSCAVRLMENFWFLPAEWAQANIVSYAAIYGTFVLEGLVVLCLLSRRFRYYGIVGGMAFHYFLGLNLYEYYIAFSALSFALHVLFLPDNFLKQLKVIFEKNSKRQKLLLKVMAVMVALYLLGIWQLKMDSFALFPITTFWAVLGAMAIMVVVICYKRDEQAVAGYRLLMVKNPLVLGLVGLYFLNGFAPYYGLKDGQTIAMFSNLHTHNGQSNHLVIKKSWPLFPYLDQVVYLKDVQPKKDFEDVKTGFYTVKATLKGFIQRNPQAIVTYSINGEDKVLSAADIDLSKNWQPNLFQRKLMSFRLDDSALPRKCDVRFRDIKAQESTQ